MLILCSFQCSIPFPLNNSQFLWMLATLTGGNGASLCSDPKLCSTAATTAAENQRGWIRDQQRKSLTRYFREKTNEKKIVYMLHKRSVSILRTLPCLQRHVLASPAGPSRASRLCCPWGHCSCTASCAMATLTALQLMAPVLEQREQNSREQSSRKQGFLPPSCRDRDVTLWTREGLWNKRSQVSRALCLAPLKLSFMEAVILFNFAFPNL